MKMKDVMIKFRLNKIISKKRLCEKIGITIPTFRKIENGNFQSMSTMLKAKVIKFLKSENININNIEDIELIYK